MADYQRDSALTPDVPPVPEALRRRSNTAMPPAANIPGVGDVALAAIEQAVTPLPPSAYPPAPTPTRNFSQASGEVAKTMVQWTGPTLRVDCVCLNDKAANDLAKAIQNFAAFLPKAPE